MRAKNPAERKLSDISEQRLRAALPAGVAMPSADLAYRVRMGMDGVTRSRAYAAIQDGERVGLLHNVGSRHCKIFVLNVHWQRPAKRPRRGNAGSKRSVPRLPAAAPGHEAALHRAVTGMPALRAGPLVASLGAPPDPEVMPAEVADMIGGLFRRIFEHNAGVE